MTVAIYLAAIIVANLTVAWFGPWWSIVNAFLFIGLDLTLRDRLHDAWRHRHLPLRMAGLIATGSILSWAINVDAGRIGIASFTAFALASTVDAVIYHRTRSVTRSNVAAAAVDSLVFPVIAFGGWLPWIVLGQFAAKVLGGEVWKRVLTHRQKSESTTRPSTGADTRNPG